MVKNLANHILVFTGITDRLVHLKISVIRLSACCSVAGFIVLLVSYPSAFVRSYKLLVSERNTDVPLL